MVLLAILARLPALPSRQISSVLLKIWVSSAPRHQGTVPPVDWVVPCNATFLGLGPGDTIFWVPLNLEATVWCPRPPFDTIHHDADRQLLRERRRRRVLVTVSSAVIAQGVITSSTHAGDGNGFAALSSLDAGPPIRRDFACKALMKTLMLIRLAHCEICSPFSPPLQDSSNDQTTRQGPRCTAATP